MKTPLRYQITEFDCGSVSLLNCITFLYEREEIPAELVKAISSYTLDCYDEHGNLGAKGTSREAVRYLSQWIANFSQGKDFGVTCKYLSGGDVTIENIRECLEKGGCVNFRTYQDCEHYVLISGIDENFIYVFDPYYRLAEEYENDECITHIAYEPFKYNRKVSISRFLCETEDECALGPIQKRECVLFNRK